jgi:hypothetical protein
MLCKFECGTRAIPSCPLLQANEAKTAKAKLDKALKRASGPKPTGVGLLTPDTKCQHTGKAHNAAPSTDDLSGTLIYTGTDMMPLVNEANPAMQLCAACQHVGCNCPRRATCKRIHDLDISKWLDITFAKWAALADEMPTLDWNCKVINPVKVAACSANLQHPLSSAQTPTSPLNHKTKLVIIIIVIHNLIYPNFTFHGSRQLPSHMAIPHPGVRTT